MRFYRGEVYSNRTIRYLGHIMTGSPAWIKKYILKPNPAGELANVTGFFRGDIEYTEATGDNYDYLLFVLVDINGEYVKRTQQYKSIEAGRREFKQFLTDFRSNKKHSHYDYVFGDLNSSHRHVFVFDVGTWAKSVDAFDAGKYSEMFNDEELKQLGIHKTYKGEINTIWQTFKGDKKAKNLFIKRIEKEFGTLLKDSDIADVKELDIPIIKNQEYLNCK